MKLVLCDSKDFISYAWLSQTCWVFFFSGPIVSFVFIKGLHLYAEWYLMSVCIFLPSVVAAMYDFIKRIQELTGLRTDLRKIVWLLQVPSLLFLNHF